MKEVSARVTGTLWHYATQQTDGESGSEVIVNESRPSTGITDAGIAVDNDEKVDLTILLVCDNWLYETKIQNIRLAVAQDITNDLITSVDVVVQFNTDGTIGKLRSFFGSLDLTDSHRVGVPTAFREDEADQE